MNIPVNANVECTDGSAGESTTIIVNPATRQVTHVVIEDKGYPRPTERLVPIDKIESTTSDMIRLSCTLDELTGMQPFVETHYIRNEVPDYQGTSAIALEPYATTQTEYIPIEEEHIPPGETAVRRGTDVEATDGHIGQVGELLVHPESGQLTHIVLLEGHLWGKKVVALPLSAIDTTDEDTVHLKLSKAEVETLPAIPVQRYYGLPKGATVEVLAAVFDNADKAEENLKFLKKLQGEKSLKLRNAAILVKDSDGKTSIKESDDVSSRQGAIFGAITGGLIGLMAGPIGAIVGAAAGAGTGGWAAGKIDMGFPDESLKKLEDKLQPGGSALIALIEHEWTVNLSQSLADIESVVFLEALTDDLVAQMTAEEGQES
jgi:uncharacterized membrane protein